MSINKLIFITAIFSALVPMSGLAGTKEAIADAGNKEASSDTWDKLVPAWDNVSNKLIDFVGEQKQKLITNLAFAAVAADLCEGLALDKEKFKAEPDAVWVATGWDAVMILAQAMQKAGSTDGAAMAKAMEGTEFNLLTGKLKWSGTDKGHEPDIEAPLVQLEKSVPRFIGWVRPTDIPAP